MFGLDEMMGRYGSYPDLADIVRARFSDLAATLKELFGRIVLNICIGNTDDHARNHAAFWDGQTLSLSPAYDLCAQLRSGGEAAQAMAIDRNGWRQSRLRGCVRAAPSYLLSADEAQAIVDEQLDIIHSEWAAAADAARLTQLERGRLWQRQILNPYIFE